METVVTVMTHGEMLLNPDNSAKMFTMPEGMTMTKVSMSAPGVCNITSEADLEIITHRIMELWKAPRNRNDWRVGAVQTVLSEVQGNITQQVSEDRTPENTNYNAFFHTADKAQSIVNYGPGEQVIEKMFSRSAAEDKLSNYDYKIHLLNVHPYPDIMSEMVRSRGKGAILFSNMVRYMQEHYNSNHITVFDFSCSVMPDISERAIRPLRRELLVKGKNGGKLRRKTNKKSTKRSKPNGHSKARTRSLHRRK